jgi:hypothetical protein
MCLLYWKNRNFLYGILQVGGLSNGDASFVGLDSAGKILS